VSEQGEDPQQQLIAALATTSRRAQDAEDELEASAAMLAVARRRIAQLEAEVASLRRAFADKIADRVLSELARYAAEPQLTVRVFPGSEADVAWIAAAARENAPREVIAAPDEPPPAPAPRNTYEARAASDVPICGAPNATPTEPPTFCALPPGHRNNCWCKDADARSYTWSKLGDPP
jgi:hypothetical protein